MATNPLNAQAMNLAPTRFNDVGAVVATMDEEAGTSASIHSQSSSVAAVAVNWLWLVTA